MIERGAGFARLVLVSLTETPPSSPSQTPTERLLNIFCYSHHINDFRRDTGHLTHEQRGVYRHLMDEYYLTGGLLPSDLPSLYRICSAATDSEKGSIAYVVGRFFTIIDGMLTHKRCDHEIAFIEAKSEKAQASAKARWGNANALPSHTERNADVMLTNNQQPTTINRDIEGIAPPAGFVWFFDSFPKKWRGARAAASMAYCRALDRTTERELHEGLKRYLGSDAAAGGFTTSAHKWLDGDYWANEYTPHKPSAGVHGGSPGVPNKQRAGSIVEAGLRVAARYQKEVQS